MTALSSGAARKRFVLLTALRWLPTGLVAPITTLLALERGLSLAEVGIVVAVQGFVVLGAELPSGTLSDAIGRRPTLIIASVVGTVSITLIAFAFSLTAFMIAFALQGIWRALDSGTLEAWFVDTVLTADENADFTAGLSSGSSALNLAMGIGALASGGLVAVALAAGIPSLVFPVYVAIALTVANLFAVIALAREERVHTPGGMFAGALTGMPAGVLAGLRLVTGSRVLLTIVAVELFWGFGMVSFETLMPARLGEVLSNPERAGVLMGPVTSAGWLAAAFGAALVPLASRGIGVAVTAAILRVLQGASVLGMGLFAGPVGVVAAYVACYTMHGAANPAHNTLLHRQATNANRAVVLSINSMIAQPGFAIGALVLGAVASAASLSLAMVVAAIVLAVAAPLYLPAWRQERRSAKE